MYFCTVNGNSWVMICILSSAHWQQTSKLSALWRFQLNWKDSDKCAYQYNNNNNNNHTSTSTVIHSHRKFIWMEFCFNTVFTLIHSLTQRTQCYSHSKFPEKICVQQWTNFHSSSHISTPTVIHTESIPEQNYVHQCLNFCPLAHKNAPITIHREDSWTKICSQLSQLLFIVSHTYTNGCSHSKFICPRVGEKRCSPCDITKTLH